MSINSKTQKFKYIMSLGRNLSENPYISSVIFDISRYGKYNQKLLFENKITEQDVIKIVEKWFSEEYDETYYNTIKEDLFNYDMEYEEALKYFPNRGSLMTDAIFLEIIDEYEPTNVKFCCGS